jgi:uncharacterized protein
MYITREIEAKIEPFLERKEAISIIGPRQAGKTTYIKHLEEKLKAKGKKVKFLTFEKRGDLELFQNSIEDFKSLANQYDCVIVDEFQYAKDGGQKLKYLCDTTDVKFIVTGSSSLDLTFQTGKYMVGRMFDFEILPFSFREYLLAIDVELHDLINSRTQSFSLESFKISQGFGNEINKRLAKKLEDYVVFGGYPAVVLSKTEIEKRKTLEGIVDKFLLKDIRSLLKLATEDELVKLQKFLAAQIGNLIKYEELSVASGLAYKELLKHLSILEKTYVVELIKPFFTNKRTELVKNPKNYFIDLGLRNYVLDDFRALPARNDAGAVMENHALNSLKKAYPSPVKYWRTKSKAEVDFVIEIGKKLIPIEVKYSSKRIIGKSLYSFIEKFEPEKAIILTKDLLAEEKIKNCQILFIPLSYL